jgi:hypothetical protein
MMNADKTNMDIREHMMVHAKGEGSMNGVSGEHIGTVDHVEGDMIKLTKNDSKDGMHHYIPLSWVASVDGNTVHLSKDAESVMRDWKSEDTQISSMPKM